MIQPTDNFNLKEYISKNYNSQYHFAKEKGIQANVVNYWCSREWKRLNYSTREKICKFVNTFYCEKRPIGN